MSQNAAILILILLAVVTANLPFLLERPLLVLPWSQQGTRKTPAALRWVAAIVQLAALAGVGWLAQWLIGQAVLAGGGVQTLLFLLRIVALVAAAAILLALPGWWLGTGTVAKSFFQRMLELLALYALVGALAFAFEAYMGNVFPSRWEFYVVTFSLYLIMGYPGFVARYLMKRRRRLAQA